MRTLTYKERARDYVMAARAQGASTRRIIFNHILPNTLMMIVTLAPFAVVGNISTLTALDYLGFGLAPPTPSWGAALPGDQQPRRHLDREFGGGGGEPGAHHGLLHRGGHPGGVRSAQIYPLSVSGGALPGHIDRTLNEDAPSAGA